MSMKGSSMLISNERERHDSIKTVRPSATEIDSYWLASLMGMNKQMQQTRGALSFLPPKLLQLDLRCSIAPETAQAS